MSLKESLRVIAIQDMETLEMRFMPLEKGVRRKKARGKDYVETFDQKMYEVEVYKCSLWLNDQEKMRAKGWDRKREEEFWSDKLHMTREALYELDNKTLKFFYYYKDKETEWFM